jgi:hypothetical protein
VHKGTTVSPRTIINELNWLSNMMKRAVAMGFVAENPVARMSEKPAAISTEAEFLRLEDAAKLIDTAFEMDTEARAANDVTELRRQAKAVGGVRRSVAARVLRARAREISAAGGDGSSCSRRRSVPRSACTRRSIRARTLR